jgi:hypothetical protein
MKEKLTSKQKEELLNEPTVVSEDKIDMSKVSTISRGEKLIGVNFNPSGNTEVDTVKRACAYLIDVVEKYRENNEHAGTLSVDKQLLVNNAIIQILNTQMNVVKVITFND